MCITQMKRTDGKGSLRRIQTKKEKERKKKARQEGKGESEGERKDSTIPPFQNNLLQERVKVLAF